MNFLNHTLAYKDLRDCTLITKNGTKIVVNIDSLEFSGDSFPKFEGCIMGIQTVEPNASYYVPEIKNVIFNDPATIVFWEDGTKTVVKCQECDEFDPEKGLAMAIAKKSYGNKGNYCNKMKKWLPMRKEMEK